MTAKALRHQEFREDREKKARLDKLAQELEDAKNGKLVDKSLLEIENEVEKENKGLNKPRDPNAFVPDFDEDEVPDLE